MSLSALLLVCLSSVAAFAQATPSPTPDSFFAQVTSSTTANSYVGGISGNGRFVVFESTGDLATIPPGQTTREVNNADGNREIFLFDYAQRRIFQLTSTTSARKDATAPAINPTTPTNFNNIAVEVSNNRPYISRDGRWIVFSSNADTPFNFDGDANRTALQADGNQEIFLYRIPDVMAADLRSGVDAGYINLRQNAFTRITNTPASRLPVAGTASSASIVADDNRVAQTNDRGSRIVFVSTRDLAAKNADANPEIFAWTRTSNAATVPATGAFTQVTNTTGAFTFNDNPSISGDTLTDDGAEDPASRIAFISNATVMRDLNDATITTNNADGNAEIFVTSFNGAITSNLTQATRTRRANLNELINVLNPGPRLSRDGRLLAFETVATDPKADTTTNQSVRGMFVYVIATDTFIQIGPRGSAADLEEDVIRFPTFAGTGDNTQIVFTSALNFTATGTRVAPTDTTGLNPTAFKQIYAAPVPPSATAAQSFTRLTNVTSSSLAALQAFVSNTTERLALTYSGELGGGNGTASNETVVTAEVFYLVVPSAVGATSTPASTSALSYFTGASERPVVTPAASPTPTPSPTPAATPITGLAPGMIGIVRAPATEGGVRFGTTTTRICEPQAACDAASESRRRPSLPVELGGVSLSINNAAAGLYFVSPTEIQFVVPVGLAAQTGTATYPVVITVREGDAPARSVRSVLQIVAAQPDIFTRSDAPTRASVFNVTNMTLMAEPAEGFPVTTDVMGTATPTRLAIFLTGIRNIPTSAITVRIGDRTLTGTTEIVSNTPTDMPGVDQLNVQLRADLAGLGDQPLVVSVTTGGLTFTSRPADTAPRIRIR
ncbi:MAG TPA: hypothetical protein VGW12_11020 [Pyrinomonadaceae bacterium]|nr:hypothetical protein [Pyrinomonadaceae bacterium]